MRIRPGLVTVSAVFLFVLGAAALPASRAHAQATDCATPRRAIDALLYWQQPGQERPGNAARCFDESAGEGAKRHEMAARLKAVLDGRGLFVKMDELPDQADWADPATGEARYVPFPNRLPEVVLVREGEDWVFPAETVAAIPALYSDTPGTWAGDVATAIPEPLRARFLGHSLWQYVGLLLLLFAGLLIQKVVAFAVRGWAGRALDRVFPKWGARIAACIDRPAGTMVMAMLFAAVLPSLQFYVRFTAIGLIAAKLVLALSAVWGIYRLVDVVAEFFREKAARTDTMLDDQLVPLLRKTAKVFVVIVGGLFVLQNLDIDVASLIAGLGIGGLAFALAAKDTVANLFGSVTIFSDRPFQIGDWIVAAGAEGIVEEVGFRSTRIRTFYNSLVTIPNSKLADTVIDNYGARTYRRVFVTLNLTYATTPEQLQAFCDGIRAILQANPLVRKDYYEVHFRDFGAHSLDVMVYFFVKVPSWSEELRQRHNVFLEILRLASALKVEFAFPTQTLHVDTMRPATAAAPVKVPSERELADAVLAFGPSGQLARPAGPAITHGFFDTRHAPPPDAKAADGGKPA